MEQRFNFILFGMQEEQLSSGVEIIQIKEDPIDCNHRIAELLFHQNCTKNAQICQQNCKINLTHDFPKNKHEITKILQFRKAFNSLQQTCKVSAEHYIRQITEIEEQALRNIAKKKAECLKQMENVKKIIMNQTYSDLEYKFPHLLDKFKNSRFDTLTCNEVFWVMKTIKRSPPMKYSEINAKLEKILKAFENFKEVSKNLNPKQSLMKQKVKDIKINQKMKEPQIKVRPTISIPKPDYSDNVPKISMQIRSFQQKKKDLERSIKNLSEQRVRLSQDINRSIYLQRQKQNKMRIQSKVYDIKILYYCEQNKNKAANLSKPNHQQMNSNHNSNSQAQVKSVKAQELSTQKKKIGEENQFANEEIQNLQKLLAQMEKQAQDQEVSNKDRHQPILQQVNRALDEQIEAIRPQEQERVEEQKIIPAQILKGSNEDEQEGLQQQKQLENQQGNQKMGPIIEQAIQNPLPQPQHQQQLDLPKPLPQQPIVKEQQIEGNRFEPWRNKELLSDIKKYGKTQSECLKVQNIDILKSFPTVHLKAPKSRINPSLSRPNSRALPQKPQIFNHYAMQLLQKQLKRKAQMFNKPS